MGDAYDMFVTSFASDDGSIRWARGFGGSMDDQANGIAVDPWRGVFVVGYGEGTEFMFNGEMQPAASDWLDGVVFRLED